MSIFPNLCLWRRSLRSNLGGIDLENLYRATLKPTLSAKTGRFDTNSSIEIAKKFRSPQVWQVWNEREQEKHFGWIFLLFYAMFVKLFTTQVNKIVSKRLCINSLCDDLTLIRHDHVSWSLSRLTAEIQRFLLFVVVSSNSSPLFLTNDGIRKNLWVFFFSLFLQQPTTMQTTISTSLRTGFDYVWGTPTWRMATVVKRPVTWVKTKNRWFTVTLQCVSIQVSTGFPGY